MKWTAAALTGLGVAVLTTGIINLPLLHALVTTDEWSRNDIITESSDEKFYLTRIREVADGHPSLGNPYIFELRDQEYPLGNLFEQTLSIPIKMLGWRIKTVSIVADFLFPAVLVWLTWMIMNTLGLGIVMQIVGIGLLFLGKHLLWWKRLISPQETTLLPLIYLWLFVSRNDSLKKMTARSVLMGLMVYSYPFHWTYCIVAEGLRWLWTSKKQGISWKTFAASFLPFVLIALPWVLQSVSIAKNPAYQETLARLGLITRHLPAGPGLIVILLLMIGVLWFVTKKRWGDRTPLLFILLASGIIVLMQPIVTGKEAELGSHYDKILMFPIVLACLYVLTTVKQTLKYVIAAATVIIVFWTGQSTIEIVTEQQNTFAVEVAAAGNRDSSVALIALLNTLPPEQVILTDATFAQDLTTYTNHYPYTLKEAYMYLVPNTELTRRAKIYNRLVPYDLLGERAIAGTQYANQSLYARTLCRFSALMRAKWDRCEEVKIECPDCIENLKPDARPIRQIVEDLRTDHVSYVLLKTAPRELLPWLTKIDEAAGYTLWRFAGQ